MNEELPQCVSPRTASILHIVRNADAKIINTVIPSVDEGILTVDNAYKSENNSMISKCLESQSA